MLEAVKPVSFLSKDGSRLFSGNAARNVEFEEFDMLRLSAEKQKITIIETADGKKEVLLEPEKEDAGDGYGYERGEYSLTLRGAE